MVFGRISYKNSLIMSIFTILLALIVVGVLVYLVNNYVPIDGKFLRLFNIVVFCIVVFWLLKVFGLLDALKAIHI